jgi:hypothetical protein
MLPITLQESKVATRTRVKTLRYVVRDDASERIEAAEIYCDDNGNGLAPYRTRNVDPASLSDKARDALALVLAEVEALGIVEGKPLDAEAK